MELFRYEPYFGSYLFSMGGQIYSVDDIDQEIDGGDAHIVKKDHYPSNGLSVPTKVQIQFTNRCNLLCAHCYASSGNAKDSEMTTEQLMVLLRRLRSWGVLQLEWSGGEVFTRKGFIDFLEYATELGFEQNLFTNGVLVGKSKNGRDIAKTLWEHCHSIQVSMDAYSEDKMILLTSKQGMWKSILNAIMVLGQERPEGAKLAVATVIRQDNLSDLGNIADAIVGHATIWRLSKEVIHGRSAANEASAMEALHTSWPIIEKIRSRIIDQLKIVHPFDKEDNNSGDLFPVEWITESGARRFMYIASNGDVYTFPYFDGVKRFFGGNVLKVPLDDIWYSQEFQAYRNVTRVETGCSGCCKVCPMWARAYNYFPSNNLEAQSVEHPGCYRQREARRIL